MCGFQSRSVVPRYSDTGTLTRWLLCAFPAFQGRGEISSLPLTEQTLGRELLASGFFAPVSRGSRVSLLARDGLCTGCSHAGHGPHPPARGLKGRDHQGPWFSAGQTRRCRATKTMGPTTLLLRGTTALTPELGGRGRAPVLWPQPKDSLCPP